MTAAVALIAQQQRDAEIFVTVHLNGGCSFAFEFSTSPPSEAASATAAQILQRVATDERFRDELFAWLRANGRFFERAVDPLPDQPLDENWMSLGDAVGPVLGMLASRLN